MWHYSVLQVFLILQGVHPDDAEAMFSRKNISVFRPLLRLCRDKAVRAFAESRDPYLTGGMETNRGGEHVSAAFRASDARDLRTLGTWTRAIQKSGGWFDQRAITSPSLPHLVRHVDDRMWHTQFIERRRTRR